MSGTTTAGAKSEAELVIRGQHTPTPWRVDRRAATRVIAGDDETMASTAASSTSRDSWEANATFIVRAVNAHDDLVKALQAHDDYMSGQFRDDPTSLALHPLAAENWKRVRSALSKAGAAQ